MISAQFFTDQYLVPTSKLLGICTVPHLQIGLGTGIQESGLRNIKQIGGPALGFFQMEPTTHDSLWENFIAFRPAIKDAVHQILGLLPPSPQELLEDARYASLMMFVKYLDCPGEIPEDLYGQAAYYKKYYNTPQGAATEEEYIKNYLTSASNVVFDI